MLTFLPLPDFYSLSPAQYVSILAQFQGLEQVASQGQWTWCTAVKGNMNQAHRQAGSARAESTGPAGSCLHGTTPRSGRGWVLQGQGQAGQAKQGRGSPSQICRGRGQKSRLWCSSDSCASELMRVYQRAHTLRLLRPICVPVAAQVKVWIKPSQHNGCSGQQSWLSKLCFVIVAWRYLINTFLGMVHTSN